VRIKRILVPIAAVLAAVTVGGLAGSAPGTTARAAVTTTHRASASAPTHTITDSVGRRVTLPVTVRRTVTLGSVPVINSFLFAVGEGDTIVSGLPPFAQNPRWKYQTVFAPTLADNPVIENQARVVDTEALLALKPDVIFTMDETQADPLTALGLKVVVLAWRQPTDVKKVVSLLGDVFGQKQRAQRYVTLFEGTIRKVQRRIATVPAKQRPRVLYYAPATLTQPHLIVEWWVPKAGGKSVTRNGRTEESLTFNAEQLIAWNPQIIFVPTRDDVQVALNDTRFANVAAIKARRVYAVPIGAHIWANRTSEQPMTVLWAAKKLHPRQFADVNLQVELRNFYRQAYGVTLSRTQIQEILRVL